MMAPLKHGFTDDERANMAIYLRDRHTPAQLSTILELDECYIDESYNEIEILTVTFLLKKGYSSKAIHTIMGYTEECDKQFVREVHSMI